MSAQGACLRYAGNCLLCICLGLLAACSHEELHPYHNSRMSPALQVPEGLSAPRMTGEMAVPESALLKARKDDVAGKDIALPPGLTP